MSNLRVAAYARVSTEKQVNCHTIDSQVTALRERIGHDGLQLDAESCFCDDGFSGHTLERPALERLRDQVSAGALDRVYIHTPDRLARKYAYVVLLLDEFRRAGVEVVFLDQEAARTPEGELLLQVQGVIAEYERAKILERSRRGRRQAAKRGAVSVFSRAPYGYRYIAKGRDGGEARFEVQPEAAEVVRQVYEWFVRDRLSISGIARRLTAAGIPTAQGKKCWKGSVIWQMLTNPAYQGRARFGRHKEEPRRPRARAFWRPPSRRALSVYATRPEEQIEVPVPALVGEDLFALAQLQLQENRRRSRLGSRGMRRLLQGLVVCQQCGHALCYQGNGQRRGYYYRCTGLDPYRWGGQRLCSSRAVRAEVLEQVVWEDVCQLLSDPSRLEQEFRRRQSEVEASPLPARPVEQLRQRVQRSISRLIDAYQEGAIGKEEFEPRLRQARQRLQALEREAAALAEQEQRRENFQDVFREFRAFAERVQSNLHQADLPTKMRILRWLIKQIEVDREEIRIIYKVSPPSFAQNPATNSLQDHPQRQRDNG